MTVAMPMQEAQFGTNRRELGTNLERTPNG
jgi:hypothetical protein